MKKLILTAFIGILFVFSAARAEEPRLVKNKFFEVMKVYSDHDFVLNDAIEFALFDLSQAQFIDDTSSATSSTPQDATTDLDSKDIIQGSTNTVSADTTVNAKDSAAMTEIHSLLENMPKIFFRKLKKQINTQQVPVTLYSPKSPTYSKPLQFYVKIKRIHLKPTEPGKQGLMQPISLRIYGELHDKKSGDTLFKFYDSTETSYNLQNKQAELAINSMADSLMSDFASFLKTKY